MLIEIQHFDRWPIKYLQLKAWWEECFGGYVKLSFLAIIVAKP